MKQGIEGMYCYIINAIYDKPIPNIRLNGEKTETISSKVRNETRVPTLSTLIQHSPETPSQSSKTRIRSKRNSDKKGISQIVLICR
jgi:hypothetical protein